MRPVDSDITPVENGANQTNLAGLEIKGLFGAYQVELDLAKVANIFIGENGLGKTTILQCMYYLLTEKYALLEKMPFDEIVIRFQNGENCTLSHNDLEQGNLRKSFSERSGNLIDREIYEWMEQRGLQTNSMPYAKVGLTRRMAEEISEMYMIPLSAVYERIRDMPYSITSDNGVKSRKKTKLEVVSDKLRKNIPENIIYLPTYRRIESSPGNLRMDEDDELRSLIHFGMKDVQRSIDTVLSDIRTKTMHGYNNMAGTLLEEYAGGNFHQETNDEEQINLQAAMIVLDRLGDAISTICKNNIRQLIHDNNINEPEYIYLKSLLRRLIDNYKKLEEYDDRINNFVNTCNRYLKDKQFLYDPSNLTLSIRIPEAEDRTVNLHQLSSGEKQIVSLFSMLYLSRKESLMRGKRHRQFSNVVGNIIIIDEPELSLSIDWQRRLLPDIIRSGSCSMLLAVTHSPFIFDNELDMDAQEIHRSICRL